MQFASSVLLCVQKAIDQLQKELAVSRVAEAQNRNEAQHAIQVSQSILTSTNTYCSAMYCD